MVRIFIVHYKKMWVPKLRKASTLYTSIVLRPNSSSQWATGVRDAESNTLKFRLLIVLWITQSFVPKVGVSYLLAAPIKLEGLLLCFTQISSTFADQPKKIAPSFSTRVLCFLKIAFLATLIYIWIACLHHRRQAQWGQGLLSLCSSVCPEYLEGCPNIQF